MCDIKTHRVIQSEKELRDIVRIKTERELVRIKIDDENTFWNEIGVNAGNSRLMLLGINLLLLVKLMLPGIHLLLPVLVNVVRHKLNTASLVAFLEKPKESDGFEGIIDFLNASSIRYALTVNPTIYTSRIKQFWATAKAKTINGEVKIQALVDGKKVIVIETSVRRALQLKDAEGTQCLPNATIL
ncbi:hypothetical protein Tco_0012320 [Tanacetum coccineum]